MKMRGSLIALGVLASLTMAGNAFALDKDLEYWNNYDPIIPDKGEFTNDYPVTSRILTSPVRVVSTIAGTAIGSVVGVGKGIVHAEMLVSQNTFERLPDDNAAMLVPAGMVGSVLAIPVGAVHGAVMGAGQGMVSGFMVPEGY